VGGGGRGTRLVHQVGLGPRQIQEVQKKLSQEGASLLAFLPTFKSPFGMRNHAAQGSSYPPTANKGNSLLSRLLRLNERRTLPSRTHPCLFTHQEAEATSSREVLNAPRKWTGAMDQWLELRRANGGERWVDLGFENGRARIGGGTRGRDDGGAAGRKEPARWLARLPQPQRQERVLGLS
jgi:hypothetical protein